MGRIGGEHIANRIRELRARDHLTQADLAQMIEVSRQTVSAIEQGEYNPSVVLALRMAEIFHEPVEYIFWFEA